jgi:hypothetical protein
VAAPLTDKLSDIDVHDRLYAARNALGDEEAETVEGNTAIEAARKALSLFNAAIASLISRREP